MRLIYFASSSKHFVANFAWFQYSSTFRFHSLFKTCSKFIPCVDELVWLFFGNFSGKLFCASVCLIFLSFVRKTFLILLSVKGGFCFATAFRCYLLIPHSLFCSVLHRRSFCPFCRHDPSHCLHLKVFTPLSLSKK